MDSDTTATIAAFAWMILAAIALGVTAAWTVLGD
jgi:hypothetical protein